MQDLALAGGSLNVCFPVLMGEGGSWPAPPALCGRSCVSFRGGDLSCTPCVREPARPAEASAGVLLGAGAEQCGD